MLYCIILGDAIRNAFLVKISSDLSISNFRKTIKKEKKPYFDDIPADWLKLWKMDISIKNKKSSTEICAKNKNIKKLLINENELLLLQIIRNCFDDKEAFFD